ncbi:hypothetical protein ACFY0B_38295 [Streptomyces sp. NPDC001797]|uniref:hypothetical protein n=1 Tax=Streptomyces sp. NPDC001797 TaxID=3364610 RepID=UPI003679B0B4
MTTDHSTPPSGSPSAETLRMLHAARAHSAYERAVAACRHAGIAPAAAQTVPTSPVGRAADALRLSAQSLGTLAGTTPALEDGRTRSASALRAALTASQAAATAATASRPDGTWP